MRKEGRFIAKQKEFRRRLIIGDKKKKSRLANARLINVVYFKYSKANKDQLNETCNQSLTHSYMHNDDFNRQLLSSVSFASTGFVPLLYYYMLHDYYTQCLGIRSRKREKTIFFLFWKMHGTLDLRALIMYHMKLSLLYFVYIVSHHRSLSMGMTSGALQIIISIHHLFF